MAETARYGLPLLEGAQAQKHVTVNEALTRLDALTAPTALSRGVSTPPAAPAEGALFIVAPGALYDWAGRDGAFALWDNGGWTFAAPAVGQRVWLLDEGREALFDGTAWVLGQGAVRGGAATGFGVTSLDHAVTSGPVSTTAPIIPDKAIVLGVTARVLTALSGPGLTGWRLGAPGDTARYGTGYGVGVGAFAHGVTGQPQAYYGDTPLVLQAEGGVFSAGTIRLCVHFLHLTPPRAP